MRPNAHVGLLIGVHGSEVEPWRRSARGAFDIVKATNWSEALAERSIDAGFVFFHLAERLGLSAADGQSVVHENPGTGPRYLVTSPKLPSALTRDPAATIARLVLEAMAATTAYDDGNDPSRIMTLGFMGADLGGHSNLSIAARARAVADGISEYHAMLG